MRVQVLSFNRLTILASGLQDWAKKLNASKGRDVKQLNRRLEELNRKIRGVKVCRSCPTITHLMFADDSSRV